MRATTANADSSMVENRRGASDSAMSCVIGFTSETKASLSMAAILRVHVGIQRQRIAIGSHQQRDRGLRIQPFGKIELVSGIGIESGVSHIADNTDDRRWAASSMTSALVLPTASWPGQKRSASARLTMTDGRLPTSPTSSCSS